MPDLRSSSVVTALVASGDNDAWLLPDDPFLNAGCRIVRATSQDEIAALCDRHKPQLLFLPLVVGGEASLTSLKRCMGKRPAPVVVVVAANDQINAAAEAMREGAFDCLFKPFSPNRLGKTIEAALKTVPRAPEAVPLPEDFVLPPALPAGATGSVVGQAEAAAASLAGVIAGSVEMRTVLAKLAAVAPSPAPVFLSGEVGTGKNLLARLAHDRSALAGRPFVRLDCAALSPARVEDELFGPMGAARAAQGGTLFLDEVGELDLELQPRILQLIGSNSPAGMAERGFRLIAATRHDPRALIRDGRLRADLYYRLHVAALELPPLRARGGDAALIARAKLREYAEAEARTFTGFSDAALDLIAAYAWPGNVRELLNMIWTLVLTHPGPLITPDMLPPELNRADAPAPQALPARAAATGTEALIGHSLAEIERIVIEATILAEGGSVPRAARVLDVSPSTLYRKREAWEKQDKR